MSPGPARARSRGAWAEDLAQSYLRQHGLEVVARNHACRSGELDIVCLDGPLLVFVEVRYRRANAMVDAAHSITASKRNRLRIAAAHYLATHCQHGRHGCRFDVVTVTGNHGHTEIEWIKDAFQD
jgi:putative endonuclease